MGQNLRQVYIAIDDAKLNIFPCSELGFRSLPFDIKIGNHRYHSSVLDMGSASVDGWISTRLTHEKAEVSDASASPLWFDKDARQIRMNGVRTDLTPLEYGTLNFLISHEGIAVTRKELLKEVWGINYEGASNVVDTIILSLRKKLTSKSTLIKSVRGIGYRYIDSN
jgi:DNA-binding response OmpR family regulator